MKSLRIIRATAVCMAVMGFCMPQVAMSATTQTGPAPVMTDVQLHQGGILLGQLVTPEYAPVAAADVSIRSADREIAVTKTDKEGRFVFSNLNSGVYQVVTAESQGTYRAWSSTVAPPSAQQGVLLVKGGDTVRGQHHVPGFKHWLSNPWFVAAVIAAAVTIPVVIHNSNKPATP